MNSYLLEINKAKRLAATIDRHGEFQLFSDDCRRWLPEKYICTCALAHCWALSGLTKVAPSIEGDA
jgi:hypothetical protein